MVQNKNLFLVLKKKWFDEIQAGHKKNEYREDKPYWQKRLLNRSYETIEFQLGYSNNAPRMKFRIGQIKRIQRVSQETGLTVNVFDIKIENRIE